MGLEVPELDDVTYEELVEHARERLPVLSPDWTDHNVHDPGITVIELLAWLAETYVYELDQVTEAHRRKHLHLLGVRPRPPRPARADVRLEAEERHGEIIETGEKIHVDDDTGFSGTFETAKPITLTQAHIERVITAHADGFINHSVANRTHGMSYPAFGADPDAGDAMYLGLDRDPFGTEVDIVDLTVDIDDADLPPADGDTSTANTFEPSVDVTWQYCTDYENWRRDDAWVDFDIRRDETDHLYRGGTIAIEKDDEWQPDATAELMLEAEREDRVDEAERDGDAFVWIRCIVDRPGYEVPPRLNAVRLDVVPIRHRSVMEDEVLERTDGGTETSAGPGQRFQFDRTPVLDATIDVGGTRWEEVRDFDASGPDDRHYAIDPDRTAIRFGDGVAGKAPTAGQTVIAESYTYGGGDRGNVPRSASCRFVDDALADVDVSLTGRATGGADAESVQEAIARVRAELEASHRGVSLEDYRELAKQTPGIRVARVAALVDEDTNEVSLGSRDVVRVVVVPYSPLVRPRPSSGFLDAVRRQLERRRLLTDRVRVEAPTYVGIAVETTVRIAAEYAESGRIEAVNNALDAFLDPLGRAEGDGWQFGRTVYKSELYQVIASVEGVDVVSDLTIFPGSGGERDLDGNVLIGDAALVYPDGHDVLVERDVYGRHS